MYVCVYIYILCLSLSLSFSALQDIAVQSRDFAGSLHGLSQFFKCTDSRHGKLVMPEYVVIPERVHAAQRQLQRDEIPNQESNVNAHEHTHAQIKGDQKLIQELSEDEYLKDALKTSVIDREQQARLLREIEKMHKEKIKSASDNIDPQAHYEEIPGSADYSHRPPYPHPSSSHSQRIQSASASQDLQRMRDQHSIQDDYLLGHHSRDRGKSNIPLQQQWSVPEPSLADGHLGLNQIPNSAHQSQGDQPSNNQYLYHNIPGAPQQFYPFEQWHHRDSQGFYQDEQRFYQGDGAENAQNFHAPPQQSQQQQDMQQKMQGAAIAVVPKETTFTVGSTVQLGASPPRYGIIHWIGTLPGILEGRIVGVELVSLGGIVLKFKFMQEYAPGNITLVTC